MTRYPVTIVGIVGLLVFGAVVLVLLAPGLKADPAQVALIVGVFLVVIQQLLAAKVAEGNGHRLAAVEEKATTTAAVLTATETRIDAVGIPAAVGDKP